MTATLDRDKLAKVAALMRSPNQHEADTARLKYIEMLATAGLRPEEVVAGIPKADMAEGDHYDELGRVFADILRRSAKAATQPHRPEPAPEPPPKPKRKRKTKAERDEEQRKAEEKAELERQAWRERQRQAEAEQEEAYKQAQARRAQREAARTQDQPEPAQPQPKRCSGPGSLDTSLG
jgi:Mg-chelatase subunit ChlI